MKTVIYCRVSTEAQEREGTSLASQLEACQNYCQHRGYQVVKQFSETYSGLTLDRPLLTELRELVRNEAIDLVVVYCLDRLTRNPMHGAILQEEREKHHIILESVTEPAIENTDLGYLISQIYLFGSKLEAEKIRERTMRGKKARALAGRLPGGSNVKLYGYNYLAGKDTGEGIRYINEEEARWVKEIFRWYAEEGLSLTQTAKRLTSLGIPNPSGNRVWPRTTIYGILKNPAYIGGDLQVAESTPAIIPNVLFEKAQQALRARKQVSIRSPKHKYLLANHIVCAHCGTHYVGQVRMSGGKSYKYYYCLKRYNPGTLPQCHNRNLRADELDAQVWAKVEEVLNKPETILAELQERARENDGSILEKSLDRVQRQIENRQTQRDRIHKAFYVTGDEATFRRDLLGMEKELERLQGEANELEHRIELTHQYQLNEAKLKEACALMARNIGTASFDEKRFALKALNVSVLIDGDNSPIMSGFVPVGDFASLSSQPKLTV